MTVLFTNLSTDSVVDIYGATLIIEFSIVTELVPRIRVATYEVVLYIVMFGEVKSS